MSRAVWWALAAAGLAFTADVGTSSSMAEVSLSCSKIGESRSFFRCDDRIVHVLGYGHWSAWDCCSRHRLWWRH